MSDRFEQTLGDAFAAANHAIMCAAQDIAGRMAAPSVLFKPSLTVDGKKWCALYGANLQDGVAGFGDSPADAMWDFDQQWSKKLATSAEEPWR